MNKPDPVVIGFLVISTFFISLVALITQSCWLIPIPLLALPTLNAIRAFYVTLTHLLIGRDIKMMFEESNHDN